MRYAFPVALAAFLALTLAACPPNPAKSGSDAGLGGSAASGAP